MFSFSFACWFFLSACLFFFYACGCCFHIRACLCSYVGSLFVRMHASYFSAACYYLFLYACVFLFSHAVDFSFRMYVCFFLSYVCVFFFRLHVSVVVHIHTKREINCMRVVCFVCRL